LKQEGRWRSAGGVRGTSPLAAALLGLAAAPLAAEPADPQPSRERAEVMRAADAFFAALRSEDRSALARRMLPEGMIFIHDRTAGPDGQLRVVPVEGFLEGHRSRTARVDEVMDYQTVLVDGEMAQVWGPYRFTVNGATTHCGINSLSMVKKPNGWKVANTSFTMVAPEHCDRVGAPPEPAR
jgi:hypothetical protein